MLENINVTLVCHKGIDDLSSINYDEVNLLKHLTSVQDGLVSLTPIKLSIKSLQQVNNTSIYPISLSVADTMCHAPADKKNLSDLGEVIGIRKNRHI